MGMGNDPRYNKTLCFETFPFPACAPAQQAKIRALGEQLDAHRKRQQALHPELTMTGMYNVLEALRAESGCLSPGAQEMARKLGLEAGIGDGGTRDPEPEPESGS